jgi:threonylcarbamoyladenosine tRNA methylthiotransferase MtaB
VNIATHKEICYMKNRKQEKTFAIKTLGCKVNQYESQVLRENLTRLGLTESLPEEADFFVLNSCTVTHQADAKTRRFIRKIKKDNPSVKIFLTGCYAVLAEDIDSAGATGEVFRVVPNKEKKDLPAIIASILGIEEDAYHVEEGVSGFQSHTRAFLKIQDGCNQNCSYCKVTLVRGPSKSKDKKDVLGELKRIVESGYKEIVLTGICLGSWEGADGEGLADLIEEIDRIPGDFRIRLSSIEPNHVDDALIDAVNNSNKICKHFHVPLQSGSDRILELMNRNYTTKDFQGLIERIRQKMPTVGISMDVICGFPGETELDYNETYEFLKRIRPSRMHIFSYSDRKETKSFYMEDKVPSAVSKKRAGKLIELGDDLQFEFCKAFLGKIVEVLVEKEQKATSSIGYSGEYLKVKLQDPSHKEGELLRVKIHKTENNPPCVISETIKTPIS